MKNHYGLQMKPILVLGFYNRANLGDEMFKETIPLLLPDCHCDFISTDDFRDPLDKYDGVICGGGDIFNHYFMTKIEKILSGYTGPVYLLGVGVPYLSMLDCSYLSLFDHIFLRETTDLPALTRRIGGRYAHALPDLGFLKRPLPWIPRGKRIGVFLAQPITSDPNWSIEPILTLLEEVGQQGELHFIRFNTSGNLKEDDRFLHERVVTALSQRGISAFNDTNVYTTDQLLKRISEFEFAVCGRFHAHIYCTIAGCPFISVGVTRKVQLFLSESGVTLPLKSFAEAWSQRRGLSRQLFSMSQKNYYRLQTRQVNALITRGDRRSKIGEIDPEAIYNSSRKLLFKLLGYDVEDKNRFGVVVSDSAARKVAAHLCFEITRSPGSKYEWGTIQNLKQRPWELRGMIDWIVAAVNAETQCDLPKLNFDHYNQNGLRGLHRAGWQYILTYLRVLSHPKGVICDTFIDRTFLWGRWALTEAGILPYTGLWIGFVHHTPNSLHTENNSEELIETLEFLQSLETCRGLICLSDYLSKWFRERFSQMGVNIPVITLRHPTLFVTKRWSPEKVNFESIRLINVGAWYRNPYAIHEVEVPTHIEKYNLRGKNMEDYFRPLRVDLSHEQILHPDPRGNKWVYYLSKRLQTLPEIKEVRIDGNEVIPASLAPEVNSVMLLDDLSDDEYDDLLSSSVIFLNLIDASAANTVIECIVRDTPILVNRHPALEEYLGKEYPLFYDRLEEVPTLLNRKCLCEAHLYLKGIEKQELTIEKFLSNLVQSEIYQTLL